MWFWMEGSVPDFLRLKYLFLMVDRSMADASKMDLETEGIAEVC
jgi:hypothetical protein